MTGFCSKQWHVASDEVFSTENFFLFLHENISLRVLIRSALAAVSAGTASSPSLFDKTEFLGNDAKQVLPTYSN